MYIIQTNRTSIDFQSYMYQIRKQTWDEFKEYVLSNEDFTDKIVNSTLSKFTGTKPSDCKVELDEINDDYHLRVKITRKDGLIYTSEYYLVNSENMENLNN